MTLLSQILWGSLVLGVCCIVHVGMIALAVDLYSYLDRKVARRLKRTRSVLMLSGALAVIVLAHTIEVWFWAWMLMSVDVIVGIEDAVYFALVTYTTVGYGDIVLPEGYRIFGVFAGVTGLLSFGFSTAFLASLLVKLLPGRLSRD